jgi:hypothetical protein
MAQVICPECGTINRSAAVFCDRCGRRLSSASKADPVTVEGSKRPSAARPALSRGLNFKLVGVAATLALGVVAGAVIARQAGWWPAASSEAPSPVASPAQNVVSVPADRLWEAYNANAAGASRDYGDARLLIEGTVMSVRPESNGAISVLLNQSFAETLGVWARFADAGAAEHLTQGRSVRVECSHPFPVPTDASKIVNVEVSACQIR